MVTRIFIAVCALLVLAAPPSMAQDQPGGGGPGPDGQGPPGPNQMRQRFEQQLKQQLGATDAEWTALQPKIEAVQQQLRDLRPPPPFRPGGPPDGAGGGPGGPGDAQGGPGNGPGAPADGQRPPGGPGDAQGGPGAGPGGPPPGDSSASPVHQATRALLDAVNSPDSKPDEIKTALQALREARNKAKSDLGKAREELRPLVTPKQEALLVALGILE